MTGNASDDPSQGEKGMVRTHQIKRGTPYTDALRGEGGDTYFLEHPAARNLPRLPDKTDDNAIAKVNNDAAGKLADAAKDNEQVPGYAGKAGPYLALNSGLQGNVTPASSDALASAPPVTTPNVQQAASGAPDNFADRFSGQPDPGTALAGADLGGNQAAVKLAMDNPASGAPPVGGAPAPTAVANNTVPGTPAPGNNAPAASKPGGGLMDGLAKALNVPAAAPPNSDGPSQPVPDPSGAEPPQSHRYGRSRQCISPVTETRIKEPRRMKILRNALFPVFLFMVALGSGPLGAAVWQWSQTAGTNGTVDPNINWAEGMAPSQVNDSARATMAALAAWRDDLGATVTTGGILTAYTATSNEGNISATPTNGTRLRLIFNVTNGTAATLQVDAGTAFPLQTVLGTASPIGTIRANQIYVVTFNSANSAWVLDSAPVSLTSITNSLSGNVAINSANSYFDGPSVAQGTSSTWFASGTVTIINAGTPSSYTCKLWDGTTVIASGQILPGSTVSQALTTSLSGVLAAPAANIKISCASSSSTSGTMQAAASTNSAGNNASTVTAFRIQ